MTHTIPIKCLNTGLTHQATAGSTLAQIAQMLGVKTHGPILGALVNHKTFGLGYQVFQPKTIEFFDLSNPEGMRMYTRSLIFLLHKAVDDLFPGAHLRMMHSVSKGIYGEVDRPQGPLTIQEVFELGNAMRKVIEADYPFVREEVETEQAIAILEKLALTDKTRLLQQRGQMYTTIHRMNHHVGVFYGPLVPSTGCLKVFDLNKYYNGLLLQMPKPNQPDRVEELILQSQMFTIFKEFSQWTGLLNISRLADLNDNILQNKSGVLIQVAEALHEKKIAQIADQISARKHEVKLILIAGPSSSGKTTFGKRLAIQLLVTGIVPLNLSLDNYFVDREKTPRDAAGDYDFEALGALDIELFNQNLLDLLAGKTVSIPKFSFETGLRYYDGEQLTMQPGQMLIVEGIHGLNPKLTHLIPAQTKFMVYVSALAGISFDNHTRVHTTDNRLIRRIVRDYKYRKYSAQDTIGRWPSVRRGEDAHIFPFQEEADSMFNSALLYELAILKPFAEPILLEVPPNCAEYTEARRLLGFLSYFKPLKPDAIPPTSILREFLGGSSFNY